MVEPKTAPEEVVVARARLAKTVWQVQVPAILLWRVVPVGLVCNPPSPALRPTTPVAVVVVHPVPGKVAQVVWAAAALAALAALALAVLDRPTRAVVAAAAAEAAEMAVPAALASW
jgi:hypothetical protein